METYSESLSVAVTADMSGFRQEMADATRLANGFGNALGSALSQATFQGKGLDDVLRGLAMRLSRLALDVAMRPLERGIAGLLGGVFAGVTPFAKGGVVSSPTLFGHGGGRVGLMGEAGAEAILPLARGSDGRLGVRAGGAARPVQVAVTINARDVESFRRAESEVAAIVARAVARGQRNL